ncbi:NAD(P)H dehydrogenase (quinone) [Kibdelosporangium banguiense]|uniref:NAD(P)H dehydrogenase (Quinone) n=1 Tax=Kibdelosporangium banguiense TaxID=1365924 RepID=A0ABS4TUW6_9PSEU|nr:NAD(P)H:quinone oxidoreductase [Kibdelosporangium banguiense]MBP2328195.1 NAD(P)H dehydrogenase (quinone) [Kibdelosporangium banguiense]
MSVRVLVAYYSATGSVHRLAEAVQAGAEAAGAEVRLRRVAELAPADAIASNPAWAQHKQDTDSQVEVVSLDDLEWADGYAFGTPTRYGAPAAQLKQFIDSASSLWHEGKLADKPVTTFVSSAEQHGGQEATILSLNNVFYHWGCVIVPLGYTDDVVYEAGGNPYGTSWPAGFPSTMPDEAVLNCARYQGRRLAHFAGALSGVRSGASA